MMAATLIRWVPCLLLEGVSLSDGITTSYPERLPGSFETCAEAMDAAAAAMRTRPDAIGYSAKRTEVSHGL
jgi:hypothetical protein